MAPHLLQMDHKVYGYLKVIIFEIYEKVSTA